MNHFFKRTYLTLFSILLLVPFVLYTGLYIFDKCGINLSRLIGSYELHGLILVLFAVAFHHYYFGLIWSVIGIAMSIMGIYKEKNNACLFTLIVYILMLLYWICFYFSGQVIRIT